jgi:nucleoid DNA-binding protein
MYGAVPYLVEEFDLSKKEASKILTQWMESFDRELSAEKRVKISKGEM